MRQTVSILFLTHMILLSFVSIIMAQQPTIITTNSKTKKDNTKIPEEAWPARYPGGLKAFSAYVVKNIKYPAFARVHKIQGKVFVNFTVETNGFIKNVKILKGLGGGCNEEAIRVLRNSPQWTSARPNQQIFKTTFTLPINFSLP